MPTEDEVREALEVLGMSESTVCCAYCGGPRTEWDHLNPLVRDKRPTGYVSEIHNLVPACGKCNQSKGSSSWETWMFGPAPWSQKRDACQTLRRGPRDCESTSVGSCR